MTDVAAHLPAVIATFLLAGLVKGVIGMGLPIIAVGLLSLAMPPAQAAAIMVLPSLATNIWQAASGPALIQLLRRLWPMLASIFVGIWFGVGLRAAANVDVALVALGCVLVLYGATGLSPLPLPQVSARAERWMGALAGAATGVVTATTGVFVLPAVPYLQALGLPRDELVQALGIFFTVSTVALAVSLAALPDLGRGLVPASLAALAAALAGMAAGTWVRRAVKPAVFRRLFFTGLLLLGAHLALRGLL